MSEPALPALPAPEATPENAIDVDLSDILGLDPSDGDSDGDDPAGALDDADALDAAVDEGDARAVGRLAARCSALHLRVAVASAAALGRAAIADVLLAAAEARFPTEVDGLVASAFGVACEAGDLETLDVLDRRGATARLAAAVLTPPPRLVTRGAVSALEITLAGRAWQRASLRPGRSAHGAVLARLIAAGAPPTARALAALLEEEPAEPAEPAEHAEPAELDEDCRGRCAAISLEATIARWEGTPELAAALDGIPGYRLGFGRGYRAALAGAPRGRGRPATD